MSDLEVRSIRVQSATADNVAPFGELIATGPAGHGAPSVFYPGTVNHPVSGFSSDADTTLIVSRVQPRPLTVRYMERHFKHTQCFIPLGGKPFLMVLAPPTADELPDLDGARVLEFDGSAGMLLAVGTWHEFPFALQRDTDLISVLRNETYRGVSSKDSESGESHNPDLDKKDMVSRLGVELQVSFGPPQTEFA